VTRDIADYALVGDCETAALVARDGSIDWLCWPRFDSGACFAALLGDARNGRWKIAPDDPAATSTRQYRGDTLVLQTDFETEGGAASVIDFMPIRRSGATSQLVRIVIGRRGRLAMRMDLALRFDYGRIAPWESRDGHGDVRAVAGPNAVTVRIPVAHEEGPDGRVAKFVVEAGDRLSFVLAYEASHLPPARPCDPEAALQETEAFWTDWSRQSRYEGPWRDAVMRSLITVKALTYRPTGGIVAAATTSLPEELGGARNWDYRYCWLRDATLTLLSLINAGYRREAEAWVDWLLRALSGSASQVQPLYGVAGEHRIDEHELPWLPGFCASSPVRIGNGAWSQLQVDAYGSVMDALHAACEEGLQLHEASAGMQRALLDQLARVWDQPDDGIWEVRSGRQHFVHSKLMSWVAFDRAVAGVERFGLQGPVDEWRRLRDRIREEILSKGYDHELGAFTQSYGSTQLDASVLLMPLLGFLPARDPRMVSTVQVIERELGRDGLLLRYDSDSSPDGLPPGEGAFLACSFWHVDNLILQGRREDAERRFERLLALRNDVGLLSEQYDVDGGRLLGNFPQAFSHFALIDTAFNFAGDQVRSAAE
jgi:GH15 family glucan-1,4-alpha-glucosidase